MGILRSLLLLPVRTPVLLVSRRRSISPIAWAISLLVMALGGSLAYFIDWRLGLKVGLVGLAFLLVELWIIRDSHRATGQERQRKRRKRGATVH